MHIRNAGSLRKALEAPGACSVHDRACAAPSRHILCRVAHTKKPNFRTQLRRRRSIANVSESRGARNPLARKHVDKMTHKGCTPLWFSTLCEQAMEATVGGGCIATRDSRVAGVEVVNNSGTGRQHTSSRQGAGDN